MEVSFDISLPSIGSSIKNEIITAENYEDINNRLSTELSEDEAYYVAYAEVYYIFSDGMESAFSDTYDETKMYVSIYGKTVEQLIKEGRQLMKDNDVTIEELKESLNNGIFE